MIMCGLFSLTPGQQDGAVAKWEERVGQIRSGDTQSVGMVTQRPLVELGKFAHAPLDATADGCGP